MRRIFFDKDTKRIAIVNSFVERIVELAVPATIVGVETEEELLKLVKEVGGLNKFRKLAEQKLHDTRKKKPLLQQEEPQD